MNEEQMQSFILRHGDGDAPADMEEMVDAAISLSGIFEDAGDEDLQLGLDELVLEASTASGALAANETPDGDEQDDAIGDAESAASDINNEGIESQVAFVLVKNGLQGGVFKLREVLCSAKHRSPVSSHHSSSSEMMLSARLCHGSWCSSCIAEIRRD